MTTMMPMAMTTVMLMTVMVAQVREHLDRFVIGQVEAKKVLAVAVCDHYNHLRRCIREVVGGGRSRGDADDDDDDDDDDDTAHASAR